MVTFGTGGWRALIGEDFTKENVQRVALALARRMISEQVDQRGVVVGYDRRFLSRQAAEWASEVLAAAGVPVKFIGHDVPTPLVMYTVRREGLPYGMMVTASHNPALYNGIKLFTLGGRDADVAITSPLAEVCNQLKSDELLRVDYEAALEKGLITEINPQNQYLDDIIATIDMRKIREKSLRVVLDPMYGVSRASVMTILYTARCDVDVIHEQHDALFGGRLPAPSLETMNALCAAVVEKHADIGLATDGDADRLGVVDEQGAFIPFNQVLVLLYYYMLKYKGLRGPVVRNLVTTHMLDKVAQAFDEKCYEVPVGFKHISSGMKLYDALLGGESSGGLTVRGYISGKDAVYAASLMVEMLAVTGMKMSELTRNLEREYGKCYMAEHAWAFDPAKKDQLLGRLMVDKELPEFDRTIVRADYFDGCKVVFEDGWVSARFSGTEPMLRVFSEMPDKRQAEAMCHQMASFLGID